MPSTVTTSRSCPASNLSSAWGVAVDPYSNVYVTYGTSVVKFPGGTVVAGGAAPDPPQSPFGICVDCFGAIYVTDYAYSRIQLWSNSSVGVTIIGYPNGTFGSGPKELNSPVDVKLDRQGNIYVLDEGNNRIQKYPPGGGTGTTVGTLPVSSGASALLVDDCGNFYVIQNLGVYKYTSASTSGTLMPPIFTGTPFGIAFDVQLNLYITVNINSTVGVTYKYAYS
ncbi:unnamed protein product [Didymodactylos carnosus]|uniref:NHL repeat-containing protein n=1 Tax=Didymodactylos carnosus TaxID=1234261 RepID=A0A815KFC2_9BILA|nr:unnamed protein product [Didymodactylos carnosus]CAF4289204.1 unnamed protein product [Didymodactylos carnosus]